MSKSEENKELCELISINKDAADFYKDAQKKVENVNLCATFKNLEIIHQSVADNISVMVRQNGGKADADNTIAGKTAKFFGELMAKVSNDVDETLVSHLEEAEDRCLHSIQNALEDDDIAPATKDALANEYASLQRTHDYMKEMKDYMKAA